MLGLKYPVCPVIAACNPYVKDWVPDPDDYCRRCAQAGVRSVWLEFLHLTDAQAAELKPVYADLKRQANIMPVFRPHELARWHKACADYGLGFYPNPIWDAFLGNVGEHPEGCAAEWIGGKWFDAPSIRMAVACREAFSPDFLTMTRPQAKQNGSRT